MGLDIYFQKQRHNGMVNAIADLNELRSRFGNVENTLTEEQLEPINEMYENGNREAADEALRDMCLPKLVEIQDEVRRSLDAEGSDELKSNVVVNIPTNIFDAYKSFDMGDYEMEEVAYFRKVNFLLPFFDYEENCSNLEISKCQVEDLVARCNLILELNKTFDVDKAINELDNIGGVNTTNLLEDMELEFQKHIGMKVCRNRNLYAYGSTESEYNKIMSEIDKDFFGFVENNTDFCLEDYRGNSYYIELDKFTKQNLLGNILPTTSGFFFGSTEYDEWYFKDVEDVRDKFSKLLDEIDWSNETLYMHCWW
jgi:hypothetical protein